MLSFVRDDAGDAFFCFLRNRLLRGGIVLLSSVYDDDGLLSNRPLRGVIVLLSSVYDDAGIGKEFAGSQVGVVCWGCRCGGFVWSNE